MSGARHLELVPDAGDYVDTAGAAAILGITANGVRDLAARGSIPVDRTGRHLTYPAVPLLKRVAAQEDIRRRQTEIPGGQYGANISHLDDHCRWMMRAGRAPRTIKVRRMEMQYLADYLGRDPVDVTDVELEGWQDSLPSNRLRLKTAMIRPYYVYLHKRGIRPDNPAGLLVTPKAKRGIPRPIAFDELKHAVINAPSPRLQAWLILAAYAGLRACEVAALESSNITPAPGGGVFIRLTETKGGYPRMTALPAWAWELIKPALATEGRCFRRVRGTGPVTGQQVSQLANEWLHKSGTASTFHSLRHAAGSWGIQAEDIRVVQELLGHHSPDVTAVYTAVAPNRIAAMVEKFPGIDIEHH